METQSGVVSAVRGPQSLPLLAESVRQPLSPRALWAFPVGGGGGGFWPHTREEASSQRERQQKQRVSADSLCVFVFGRGVRRPVAGVAGLGFLSCFIAKRAAAGVARPGHRSPRPSGD